MLVNNYTGQLPVNKGEKRNVRKTVYYVAMLLFIVLTLSVLTTGCGGNNRGSNPGFNPTTATPTPFEPTWDDGDFARYADVLKVKVTSKQYAQSAGYRQVGTTSWVLLMQVDIANVSSDTVQVTEAELSISPVSGVGAKLYVYTTDNISVGPDMGTFNDYNWAITPDVSRKALLTLAPGESKYMQIYGDLSQMGIDNEFAFVGLDSLKVQKTGESLSPTFDNAFEWLLVQEMPQGALNDLMPLDLDAWRVGKEIPLGSMQITNTSKFKHVTQVTQIIVERRTANDKTPLTLVCGEIGMRPDFESDGRVYFYVDKQNLVIAPNSKLTFALRGDTSNVFYPRLSYSFAWTEVKSDNGQYNTFSAGNQIHTLKMPFWEDKNIVVDQNQIPSTVGGPGAAPITSMVAMSLNIRNTAAVNTKTVMGLRLDLIGSDATNKGVIDEIRVKDENGKVLKTVQLALPIQVTDGSSPTLVNGISIEVPPTKKVTLEIVISIPNAGISDSIQLRMITVESGDGTYAPPVPIGAPSILAG